MNEAKFPLEERWQRDLRHVLAEYVRERPPLATVLPYRAYCFFIAELLRWARDEHGCDPDALASEAAYFAIFSSYGGKDPVPDPLDEAEAETDEAEAAGGVQ